MVSVMMSYLILTIVAGTYLVHQLNTVISLLIGLLTVTMMLHWIAGKKDPGLHSTRR